MGRLGSQNQQSDRSQIFGSFFLADNEFAVPITFIREVVNAPAVYSAVPLAPPYLKGLVNLRGTVIPVIDLRNLLKLSGGGPSDSAKIAVIELDGNCVGLLFDRTGEIFRSTEEERNDFEDSHATSVISGVFKRDGGQTIIQILAVDRLFKLQNVPTNSNGNALARESLSRKRGHRMQCISFVVGPAKCALPISGIQEILKIDKINRSVLGGGFCIGAINLRGVTVPVIDFASLLKYRDIDTSEEATKGSRRILVLRLENELFGLLVDSVDSIISYFPDELLNFARVEQERGDMFLGCITGHGDLDILLLDYQKILSNAEVLEITHGHSKLFQSQNVAKGQAENSQKDGNRSTYITFSVDGVYAVSINEVREIIDYPSQLMQPPGLKDYVRGVLNLRGSLVTIVDARSLYSKSKSDSKGTQKVLVFQNKDVHFGLVVDSIDSIVTFAEKDRMNMPQIAGSMDKGGITSDITETAVVVGADGTKKNILILRAEKVAMRVSHASAA